MSEVYSGILDQESGLGDALSANVFTPVVLPFLFLMIPIVSSVLFGLFLNYEYPLIQPGQLTWFQLPVWYALEIWYVIRQWKKALKEKWLSLRYWVGKIHFDLEVQVIRWELMGSVEAKSNAAASRLAASIKNDAGGDKVFKFFLRGGPFPLMYVALKDVPDRLLNFTGNVGNVIVGGLLFEVKNIAAVSFIRCDFTATDEFSFIPIGVFNDCAQNAEEIANARKVDLPTGDTVKEAPQIVGRHDGSLYRRKYLDEKAMRINVETQRDDIEDKVKAQVSYAVDKFREGDAPFPVPSSGGKVPGSRGQWLTGIVVMGAILFIAYLIFR